MAIGKATSEFFSGNFSDAFGYLFVPADTLQAQTENEAHQSRILNDQRDNHLIDEQTYQEELALMGNTYHNDFNNPETSPLIGFKEGAAEGLAAEQSWFKNTLGNIAGGVLGFIPWWVWLLGGVALIVWFNPKILQRRTA